jgi:hypothetical protein
MTPLYEIVMREYHREEKDKHNDDSVDERLVGRVGVFHHLEG